MDAIRGVGKVNVVPRDAYPRVGHGGQTFMTSVSSVGCMMH